MKAFFMKNKNEYISLSILMLATGLILIFLLQLWNITPSVPLEYKGNDEMSSLVSAKMLISQSWNLSCDRLGAPYISDFYDFSANMFHNFDLIVLKIFVMITKDAGMAVNLQYLSTFFLISFVSYMVMRELKITHWISICGSLIFVFMPFIFIRGIAHIVLSSYYFVPLSILLCFWIYERDDILVFNKQFLKNKRNWFTILFVILIANNGIAYYPFFTCFLLIVTMVSKILKSKDFKVLLKGGAIIMGIGVFMIINLIPALIYHMKHGSNGKAIVRDGIGAIEIYGLKIIQLFLPVDNHGVNSLKEIIDNYNDSSVYINENISSYLGMVGICGFIILVMTLFLKKQGKISSRLSLLAELNIAMVFLAISGGFSVLFALLISNKIRGYNRISIFIAYVCILSVAFVMDMFYKNHKKRIIVIISAIVTLFCIWEQFPTKYIPKYEENYSSYMSDKKFVSEIEERVVDGGMIFQMPFHMYPEGGEVNKMKDYHLFIGYIHSDTLRWSYGAIKGREGSDWSESAYSFSTIEEKVKYIKNAGFKGIYIERRAYEESQVEELESQLTKILGSTPIYSDNENLSFFIIK